MRPGMRELTTTSLASTVPMSWRSDEWLVENTYQTNEMMSSMPIRMRMRFRGFIVAFSSGGESWLLALASRRGRGAPAFVLEHDRRRGRLQGTSPQLYGVMPVLRERGVRKNRRRVPRASWGHSGSR